MLAISLKGLVLVVGAISTRFYKKKEVEYGHQVIHR